MMMSWSCSCISVVVVVPPVTPTVEAAAAFRQAFCWYRKPRPPAVVVRTRRIHQHQHQHQHQKKRKKAYAFLCCSSEEYEYQVVSAINTSYNDILILDTADSRMLLLDSTHNIHSIFMKNKSQAWTGSYWDEFASLPPGGGTAAHLMLTLWPSLHLHGWEIDHILIDKARDHLGLSHLEIPTHAGGRLTVHIGDALSTSATIPGGYAGIVIDLFSGGEVLSQLQQVQTWLEINDKLMPNGRIMVNCGGSTTTSDDDGAWENNSTLKTLCEAFPGQVNWIKMPKSEGENYLALTGPLPDLAKWATALPDRFASSVVHWASCSP